MSDRARGALLAWFDTHKRDLPWRRTRDPYAIWVSEIMLQQTRVAAVLEHYRRWMERFPSVAALAEASEPEVLAAWSGLGYYRRARMLHRAAQAVVAEHGGQLPRTAAELRELPGIGEYTSAAIASIAFGEPIAVVDGNVERVVMRLGGLSKSMREGALAVRLARRIRMGAQKLVDPERAGDSNQAMMELGATICLPKAPLCLSCPVQPWCRTRGEHPVAPRKAPIARAITYALVERPGEVLLRQRAGDLSLMAGMWELPEWTPGPEVSGTEVSGAEVLLQLRHAITITNYAVSVMRVPQDAAEQLALDGRWAAVAELPQWALTGLARKILRRLALWPT